LKEKPKIWNGFYAQSVIQGYINIVKKVIYVEENKKILIIYTKKKFFNKFLKTLDNNDGFFYLEFSEKTIGGEKGIKGYCFIAGRDENYKDFKSLNAEEYLKTKWYSKELEEKEFSKTQLKEFNDGLKIFSELKVIEPIKVINYRGV